eukprot:4999932-Pyramimonas_sp.AAC.1
MSEYIDISEGCSLTNRYINHQISAFLSALQSDSSVHDPREPPVTFQRYYLSRNKTVRNCLPNCLVSFKSLSVFGGFLNRRSWKDSGCALDVADDWAT